MSEAKESTTSKPAAKPAEESAQDTPATYIDSAGRTVDPNGQPVEDKKAS